MAEARPRCSVFIAQSLDGFIARPDGSVDWLDPMNGTGEDYGYGSFIATIDVLVVGRGTYDKVLGFEAWPYAGKRVIVLTRSSKPTSRHGEEFSAESPNDLARRLGQEGVKRAYVDGGAVIRSFLAARLIDDITLSTVPVLLGHGLPLFGDGVPERVLVLEESRSFPTGLSQNRYRFAP